MNSVCLIGRPATDELTLDDYLAKSVDVPRPAVDHDGIELRGLIGDRRPGGKGGRAPASDEPALTRPTRSRKGARRQRRRSSAYERSGIPTLFANRHRESLLRKDTENKRNMKLQRFSYIAPTVD